MSGNSPGEVKTHLRKLIKQPSMIQSVDRVTKHDKKKHHRDKVNEGVKYTHAAIDKSGKVIGMASQERDAKDMARRNKGRVVKLKKPMSDKKGDMMINRPFKEGAMSRIASTGSTLKKPKGLDTFKPKPKEQKEKTSGKVDYGSDESIKIMKKKTPGEQNEQNRFNTMLLPKLQKAKAALANMKKTVMGTNPTGNQQRKKYVPGIRQNIRNK